MITAQNVHDLVSNHGLDGSTGGLQILTGIEVAGMLIEVLTDGGSHGQTQVRVDVDLADGQLGSVAQLLLRDTDGVGHLAAVLVDVFTKS